MAIGFCRDCGHMLREEDLPGYEPACPECGCLYPLDEAATAAGELAKDKTAKRAGCIIAVVTGFLVIAAVLWFIYNR